MTDEEELAKARRRFAIEAGISRRRSDGPALHALAETDPDPMVRRAALWSLSRLSGSEVPEVAGVPLEPSPTLDDASVSAAAELPDGAWVERAVHDLLNLVQGLVGELDEISELPGVPSYVQGRLDAAETNARFLAEVGASMLDAARFDRCGPRLQVSEVDVSELVRAAVSHGQGPTQRSRVRVLAAEGLSVHTDRVRLLRVVLNLVWNACKHSASSAPVRVVVCARGGGARIEVRDRGPGMSTAELARLRTAYSTGRRTVGEGWGLGLSTAMRLVRELGGQLDVETRPTVGTVVSVWVPEHPDAAAPAPPSSSESSSG